MEAVTRMVEAQQADVLAAAAAGDEIAFRRLVSEHHEDMRRVCMAMARDASIVDDATQSAWLIAWRKIGNVRDAEHLRPWLVSVAVNETKRLVRKRSRRTEVEVDVEAAEGVVSSDPGTSADAIDMRAAMLRLDPEDRALLAMRYGAGFDSNELAIATGKKPAAVRQRLKRLLDRLREDLDDG